MSKKKMTQAQKEEKIAAAKKRQEEALKKQARKDRAKKIGIVLVCIILVIGLAIPTVALSLLSGGM